MIEIISVTRMDEPEFWSKSALGISLARLIDAGQRLLPFIHFNNFNQYGQLPHGLPQIYNTQISTRRTTDRLVFIHDDVWIDDNQFVSRVEAGLAQYDVIGVAGNRRWLRGQQSWIFLGESAACDWDNLSGSIGHGTGPAGQTSHYGPAPAECELLDGVFLATKRSTLRDASLQFDERFRFHFYDLDFCRNARERHLRLGTWPIRLTHQSGGSYGTPEWREQYGLYRDKWGA